MTPNLDDKREPGHASESTRLSPTAPSQMSNRTKIAIAAAGALVLVAGGVLIGGRLGGEGDPAAQAAPTAEAPAPSEPTPEAPVTPGPQETAEHQPTTPAEVIAAIDVENTPPSILELGTYSLLSPENQTKMHSLYEMDVAVFREQPYEDQVAFGMQILDNMRPRVDHDLAQNDIDLHYKDTPTTAQDIHDNITYIDIVAARLFTKDEESNITFDNDLALKLISITQDVNVASEDGWDSLYGQVSLDTAWSFESMYNNWKVTVTSESLAEDGTLTYESFNSNGSLTVQARTMTYASMLDGSAKQLMVVTNTEVH